MDHLKDVQHYLEMVEDVKDQHQVQVNAALNIVKITLQPLQIQHAVHS